MWDKILGCGKKCGEKSGFSTGEFYVKSFPQISTDFPCHVNRVLWEILRLGIDVAGNVPYHAGNGLIGIHQGLDLIYRGHDRGVITVLIFRADVFKGHVRQLTHKVHGYLPGQGGVLAPALAPEETPMMSGEARGLRNTV